MNAQLLRQRPETRAMSAQRQARPARQGTSRELGQQGWQLATTLLLNVSTFALVIFTLGCEHELPPATPPGCGSQAQCCHAGDASACEPAAALVEDGLELLERGCELGNARACLHAAAVTLGSDAADVERLVYRACELDPGVSYGDVECADLDSEVIKRAERLSIGCQGGKPGMCQAFGDLLRAFDGSRVQQAYSKECELGGLLDSAGALCTQFLDFLATPPSCPEPHRSGSRINYIGCPSDAKPPPPKRGTLAFEKPDAPVSRKLASSEMFWWCYAATLVDQPKLGGRVQLSLTLDRLGRFVNIDTAGSDFADPLALECFIRQAGKQSIANDSHEVKQVVVGFSLYPWR